MKRIILILLLACSTQAQTLFLNNAPPTRFVTTGSTLFNVPASGGGGVVGTDNFTRTDSSTLGANWTPFYTSLTIFGNTAMGITSTDCGNLWTSSSFHNNQYSKAVIANVGSNPQPMLTVRGSGSAGTFDGYQVYFSSTTITVYRRDNNAATQLSTTSQAVANGNTIELDVNGSSVQVKLNGSIISALNATDSTYTSGSAGLGSYDLGQFSSWEGGNIN